METWLIFLTLWKECDSLQNIANIDPMWIKLLEIHDYGRYFLDQLD